MLEKIVDGYFKIVDPQKYNARMTHRDIMARETKFRYRQATKSRLSKNPHTTRGGSGDGHMNERDLKVMRELSRELDRDNLFAASILDRLEESIFGTGLNLTINTGNKRWDKQALKLFNTWWNDKPENRDIFSGGDLERILFRSKKVDGDLLIIKLDSGQIQVIEGDRIQTPSNMTSNTRINSGVEINDVGKIIKFYVCQSEDKVVGSKRKYVEYSADDCIFIAERHRISMTRGVPVFIRNMDLFTDIDEFMNASVVQQKVSASHCMFVERKGGLEGIDGVETGENSEGTQQQQQYIEAGTVMYGEPGESAHMLGAGQTGQQFSPFVTQLLRFAGLIYGLPLELLSLDFSKTNFSSARSVLQVAHRSFSKEHRRFVNQLMAPIVKWKLRQFIKVGKLPQTNSEIVVGATPPKMISIDPMKETQADIKRINAGLTSMRDVCAMNGISWSEMLAQRQEEIAEAAKIASKLVKSTDEKWTSRDILGISKTEAYAEETTNPE